MKSVTESTNEFFDEETLAQRWRLHRGTLCNWRSSGQGPKYVKIGKHRRSPVLYKVADIIEFEETNTVTPLR